MLKVPSLNLRKFLNHKFIAAALVLAGAGPLIPAAVPVQAQSINAGDVSIWWPTNHVSVTGSQPFKAALNDRGVDQYNMFWQVDNGQWNYMSNSNTDYPHKEVQVDVSGWHWNSDGVYHINFIAQDFGGKVIAESESDIIVNAPASASLSYAPAPSQSSNLTANQPSTTTTPPRTTDPGSGVSAGPVSAPPTSSGGNALSGEKLYIDQNSDAAQWIKSNSGQTSNTALMQKIASQSSAAWFGNWNSNIQNDVSNYVSAAASQNAVPVLVAYNIPQRDCGSYSAGGASDDSAYQQWISQFAAGIGNRKVIVVLEPDAVSQSSCLSGTDQQNRFNLLSSAVSTLKANANTAVYLDAGNSSWLSASDEAALLNKAGISKADGFSLNVSNFYTTASSVDYGNKVSALVGNKHFVVDTSRNGNGSDGQWCNPQGVALGNAPTTSTGNALADAFLWLKTPGESDGTCNGGPSAGVFWPQYALMLAQNAK